MTGPLLGFGLPVSGSWAIPSIMTRVARRAEELGYHSLWGFQRLLHPAEGEWGPMYRAVHDPIVALAHVAAVTERTRLGLAIVNAPYYAPIVLAKLLTTLDAVSAGRLDVGLGLGWAREEFQAVGTPYDRRGARLTEFIACLRAIWTEPTVSFDGAFYRIPPSRVEPKPVQRPHPPLLLGGGAEPALRRVGRLADGWISASRHNLARVGDDIALMRRAAREAGRNPDRLRFVIRGVIRVDALDAGPDRRPLHGSARQIRDDLERLGDRGVTEVFLDLNFDPEVGSPDADPAASLRRAEELLETFAPAGSSVRAGGGS